MYLKQLKLAGFKSFVDSVTIPLHKSLVAVVGPNGCGKSNIIDAVRWVMGESSAKSLRGESMSDVIFGGSSQRKALGQASVELLFDNSMGTLTGQYGSYQEIAVKRVVTRDGESLYYLNGTRCRRRDITDIFLGTGAGARSYSIIGQGTISRLIEARPEELRAYLEEAAGTSKYKERRRETVQRISATRENLLRVADIRDELDKQLQRLESQAKTANRYKALCEEERQLKATIAVLKWQAFESAREEVNQHIRQLELTFTEHETRATEAFQQQTTVRLQCHDESDALQQIQSQYHQKSTEVARLEEHQQQQQREKQRLVTEQQQLHAEKMHVTVQIEQDRGALQEFQEERVTLQMQIDSRRIELTQKQDHWQLLQSEESDWQNRLNTLQQASNQALNTLQLAQTHATHHNQRCQDVTARLQSILVEQTGLQARSGDFNCEAQEALRGNLQTEVLQKEEAVFHASEQGQALAEQLAAVDKVLQTHKNEVYQLSTRLAALQAWIASSLGRGDLSSGGVSALWQNETRLAEVLHVEQEWVFVCEMIFGDLLQGVIIKDMADCRQQVHTHLPKEGIFVTSHAKRASPSQFPRLVDKMKGLCPQYALDIEKIYAARDWDEALSWLPCIGPDESIVTQDGHWLGVGWLRIFNLQVVQEASVLARQHECQEVQDALAQATLILNESSLKREDVSERLASNRQETPLLQQGLAASREQLRQCESELTAYTDRMDQIAVKASHLASEQAALNAKLSTLQTLCADNEAQAQQADEDHTSLIKERDRVAAEYAQFQENLKSYGFGVETVRGHFHELALQMERVQLKIEQLEQSQSRDWVRLDAIVHRLASTDKSLLQLESPGEFSAAVLAEKLLQQQVLEQSLRDKKQLLESLQEALASHTQRNQEEGAYAKTVKDKIQEAHIEAQILSTKASGILEQILELGHNVEEVLATITTEANLEECEHELIRLVDKIKRLGPINLVAIDEYAVQAERKNMLDQQNQDLLEALELLESAVHKMDKEMQQRFQGVFSEVNARFQVLFPRLFGGGHASLELTCDNLLEAGVVVMARPPGKRNSTIHLLSGGEKAMTAVALVFAIFQLNPSPFCMLDEVDAPLDDVNVGRFCELMKEMSQLVQFLFITHNKVTMLLAEQLIGVTMREPGVSRIVAVDVEQALLMSDTVKKVSEIT
jgi:chromosome segregation protein